MTIPEANNTNESLQFIMQMQVAIHLTASKKLTNNDEKLLSQTIINKFIEACIKLDASIIEPYIEENEIFENKEKYLFLAELKKMFQPYQSKAIVFSVRRNDRMCLGCSQGKKVLQFTIYSTNDESEVDDFGFVLDTENGILKDIYRCWQYKDCEPYQIKPEGLPAITIRNYSCK